MSFVFPHRDGLSRPTGAARRPLPSLLRRGGLACWRAVAFYSCLVALGVLLLGGCLVSGVLTRVLPPHYRHASGRSLISWCARTFFQLTEVLGLVRLDLSALDVLNTERGLIIAPNHPSMLDALLIASRVRRTGCIMKAGLWNNPFLGAGARLAGYIRNDSVNSMIRQAAADLSRGDKVLIFPEATRSSTPTSVNPLTAGIALIAQRAGAPIQTVLIEAESAYLCKGWPLFRRPTFPLRYRVTLGPRFVVQSERHRTLAAMQHFFADNLAAGIGHWTVPASAHRIATALSDV
ncbi:MAG: lysophospholipid acyltransferase family protein [Burkholderiales bacterium]